LLALLLVDGQAEGGLGGEEASFDFHSLFLHVDRARAMGEVGAEGEVVLEIGFSAPLAPNQAIRLHFKREG